MICLKKCSTWAVLSAALVFGGLPACGLSRVQWGETPHVPERVPYHGAHGQPRAYGGGVCAIRSSHTHAWKPVPREAFRLSADGFRDGRAFYPYFGNHSHIDGTCYQDKWHLHLEPPMPHLRWNAVYRAFTNGPKEGESLIIFGGPHRADACHKDSCNVPYRHGHRPCKGP